MKSLFLTLPIVAAAVLLSAQPSAAAEGGQFQSQETPCLPGVYSQGSPDCLQAGPADYLQPDGGFGNGFPLQPLDAHIPGTELTAVPYRYARVTSDEAGVYDTVDLAMEGKYPKRYIPPGFRFISYTEVMEVDGKKFYLIDINEWMRGADLSAGVATSPYQGLVFKRTPDTMFGWILYPTQPQRTPGIAVEDPIAKTFNRWDVVRVYAIEYVEERNWYLIGPDQWVEERNIGVIYPNPAAPEGVENGRWIEINLFEQTISVYENNTLVYAALVSSGVPGFWTRPGLFQITEKQETTYMTGAFEADRSDYYFLEDVPWTMYFDQARALHGAYWHNNYGYVTSHGCANLSPGDAQWLFNWANVGDWVYVWDPSGETPTDPSLYTEGGA